MESYTIPIPVKDWDRFFDNYRQGAESQGVTSQDGNSMLVLAHGTHDGRIEFRGNIISPREFIERNITTLKRKGVENITFLSCHCGTQESGVIDGISFAPMFPEQVDEIDTVFRYADREFLETGDELEDGYVDKDDTIGILEIYL